MPIEVTPITPATPAYASYLTVAAADALATGLPGLSSYLAASSSARANALAMASERIDTAMPYQGRKYDLAQVLEFPRIAYSCSPNALGTDLAYPSLTADPAVIWNYDTEAQAAVVPDRVTRACLFEADSILSGSRDERLDAQHDGLAGQSVGGMSESYRADAAAGPGGSLCRRAAELMAGYRLRSGPLL